MAIAGRVAIVPKGEWSQSVTYDKLDLVTYNGNTFIAYKSSVGVEPVDGDTWMLVMQGIDPQDIENIIDGTTPVGKAKDSEKLGGKEASEYVAIDAYTGQTTVKRRDSVPLAVNSIISGTSSLFGFYNNDVALGFLGFDGANVPVYVSADGTQTKTLATTADLANYLPKTGGTVTGALISSGGFVVLNPLIRYGSGSTNLGYIGFTDANTPIFRTTGYVDHTLLHTGNKPFGSYTGNGSATAREINVGGVGRTLVIEQANHMIFVGHLNAVAISNNGEVTYFPQSQMKYENGILRIATDSGVVNYLNAVYYYQVL